MASKNLLPEELELDAVYGGLIPIKRLDKVYADLEALVDRLGALRDERKNIIYFSDTLPSPRPNFSNIASDPDPRGKDVPRIGVNDKGQLTTGRLNNAEPDSSAMRAEKDRLLSIDFDQRFKDLLRAARQANVSFYTVRPGGLDGGSSLMLEGTSNLVTLAEQTDGISLFASNDLRTGMAKIAADLSSHYVLGYYTNNTRWDGGARRLTVKLKSTGKADQGASGIPRADRRRDVEHPQLAQRDAGGGPLGRPDGVERAGTRQSLLPAERLRHDDRARRRRSSRRSPRRRSRAGGSSRAPASRSC